MGFNVSNSITYDSTSYAGTRGVPAAASGYIASSRAGRDAAFSDHDRAAAMGAPGT
jgi:hypothetical protein